MTSEHAMFQENSRDYWDATAGEYQKETQISVTDFHYGPLVYGDSKYQLLPEDLSGLRCYEFGCGAAQNSIYLASQGADCVATDISDEQVAEAKKLVRRFGLDVELFRHPMESPLPEKYGKFDLVHSSYVLSFSSRPHRAILNAGAALKPGGTFIFSTGHPAFAGEWMEIDDEFGTFIRNYFNPVPDIRYDDKGNEVIRSNFFTFDKLTNWISHAGMMVERILEPAPVKIRRSMTVQDIIRQVPYFSTAWWEHYERLANCPVVTIFKCRKVKPVSNRRNKSI